MRLIITDDHRLFREGLKMILAGIEGIEIVGESGDGVALIKLLETVGADVVLLDLEMSPMRGFQVLELLRDEFPDVKALVLSMHDEASYVARAVELGAAGYLLKIVGKAELVRALRTVAEGNPYIQGELAFALVEGPNGTPGEPAPRLSRRQNEILQLLTQGLENKQIARQLGVSETTVKSHLRVIYAQLEASSRAEAVAVALRLGLVD